MKSRATRRFWAAYRSLPAGVQEQARRAYRLFQDSSGHPSLRFKKISSREPIYSVRVTLSYRALGILTDDEITWFWIGDHEDYDRLIANL